MSKQEKLLAGMPEVIAYLFCVWCRLYKRRRTPYFTS